MYIGIRVDASYEIGSGHVMRCVTLAKAFMLKGAKVLFICRNLQGNMNFYIREQGLEVLELPQASLQIYNNIDVNDSGIHCEILSTTQEQDALQTCEIILNNISQVPIDLMIVDHYGLDGIWQKKIRCIAKKVMVIDDLANRKHNCNFLLDQNYYVDIHKRYVGLVDKDSFLMLGPQYALLREEFFEQRNAVSIDDIENKRILVFFGSSDPTNETYKVLSSIQSMNLNDLAIDVIVGKININKNDIKTMADSMRNVNYYCQISNMNEVLSNADVAVCASGSFTWERYCLGIPGIIISVADNQKQLARDLTTLEIDTYLGHSNEVTTHLITVAIEEIISNPTSILKARNKAYSIVDGNGVNRVIDVILRKL
ncbi:UDP-2,4-diacetamido-2,4,6-trideoxy-beta-L-altropyranose hydrolase [Heliorestis acidaminivorans]|uniref:UDP-2,4-diacetamido-2,4, 6-trideoxy-beta-L-altropyranose hydrolase n=1 Tax=Heliorestis acidaminivorans TaxID=553427 RepID=A0A6I0F0U5_9FIRM|nr:UDP-2,4-diacetamido-2,4,6-trideoxy-beta-L-altropyranose hydrolase [Heliorestis acidaminivorans]KAB2952944.1 UDP-2,4-diacetamido-2,4,6-trideoxy-beta-L-altropyranose hydrolase [Heliorestis acidaminivorans]